MSPRVTVALLHTSPETVLEDYARLMELAGLRIHLDPSATTLLNSCLGWHFPYPSANTTPWQLEGALRALRAAGFGELIFVDHTHMRIGAFKDIDLNGYMPIVRSYGISVRSTFNPQDMRWIHYIPRARMLVLDRISNQHIRVPDVWVGKNVVHLPTMRSQRAMPTLGAMWNAADGLLGGRWHDGGAWMHEVLVDALAIQKEIHAGIFAVMDGTTVGNGSRSRTPAPEVKSVILASADLVALDAVAARLMGFDPLRDLKYIRLAHERGLGVGDVRAITLVGDAELASANWHFRIGPDVRSPAHAVGLSLSSLVQQRVARTPLASLWRFGSEIYRDYYRWPARSRQVFESWLRGTRWGRLFQEYQKRGYQRIMSDEAPRS